MKKINPIKLSAVLLALLVSPASFAGPYDDTNATIYQIKSADSGYCWIRYRLTNGQEHGATWSCTSAYGINILNLASIAYLTGVKTTLSLEGNGADSKPLYNIQLNGS